MKRTLALCLSLFGLTAFAKSQTISPIPKVIEKNGRHALLVDGKPFLMLGGQAHNSSAWPGMMPQVWQAMDAMHANTLEVPLYWEQIEPQQGKFDFSVVDTLLKQARAHKVRLVLLWFATWKNGSNHYMPAWMKAQSAKYPNIEGKGGKVIDSPSPHAEATLEADTRAFATVMRYLKKADPQHTVIMVQVENEPGAWDTVRDYSPLAQKLFDGAVPPQLLKPQVLKALNRPTDATGNWQKVFGNRAEEYFHAWSVAYYIGKVAAAGKAEYGLPLYVNAALRDPLTDPMPPSYESGGPTDNVIPIWKAAAPAIDVLSPDIYLQGSERIMKVIELYDRADNALFVPEASLAPHMSRYMYDVIARGGIGFSPFGIDSNLPDGKKAETVERLAPFGQEYKVFAPMMRELAAWGFDGKIKAVVEREDNAAQTMDLGAWQAKVTFGSKWNGNDVTLNATPSGKAMVVKLSENEFVVIGSLCHITFKPLGANEGKVWQYLKVEEGRYENGVFKALRILNGDETDWGGPRIGQTPVVLKISLVVR
ncbi:GH35 family beta-galactosidase [Mucilaginibacter pedocola]|uniref:Glycoside hydrolase n=1 Tax=Mucilaginibacter pedocola TaxID=1792845 RepID=A0A1S9PCF4_9SPHI|nr:DUF5597 domain-containing protein [Mucilaginibacter pedocola]OOQ58497.1 hypothetical protein BC343_07460 [Mucilaginibacter pedocola]